MIPSLVAGELKEAIVEYLSTTFALSDDETRAELARFLADRDEGIFRGPFLRVRTPFRPVDAGWSAPLDWLPAGFVPYLHQAQAFERLSSRDGPAHPTIITTGTGSGKTEAFLFPILDHCLRARAQGDRRIKAVLLYPMNALATDQARRLARLLHDEPGLSGVTAGLYVGGDGSHAWATRDDLIDKREVLRESPPDILLTNYKMLDWLLLRRQDRDLWAGEGPSALSYVVLDEFHTYDGAQGTDVAMLMRRLGASLGLACPGRPLGDVTPVATSATLGSGPTAVEALLGFAERVFGVPFPADAVIGETRQTIDEACGPPDYNLPIPEVGEALEVDAADLDGLAALFTGSDVPLDPVELGATLLRHHLTRAVLAAASDQARPWQEAVEVVVTRVPSWGATLQRDRQSVESVLARYLALLSLARRPGITPTETRPLFAVEVQVWIREVSRLLRDLSVTPRFWWMDAASSELQDGSDGQDLHVPLRLPSVYCRHCGRAGWMAIAAELGGRLRPDPPAIYASSSERSSQLRALIRARPEELDVRYINPATLEVVAPEVLGAIPVLMTQGEDEAKRDECPSCRQADGIRFLGSRVASLASVCISQLFGSTLVHAEERKLLAFTDSVQDASHRAAFFAGRTHRFNIRTLTAGVVAEAGRLSLDDVGSLLLVEAGNDKAAIHALVPPDLLRHPKIKTLWTVVPSADGRRTLDLRLRLEAALEVGLLSRVGRTLELTGSLAAAVDVPDGDELGDLAAEVHRHLSGQMLRDPDLPGYGVYARGLLERLRLRGGIHHPWLDTYVAEDGNAWRVWGGRDDGCPPFPSGQSRPGFFTTGSGSAAVEFDSLSASARTPTWLVDWAVRTLGVAPGEARALNLRTMAVLAGEGIVEARTTRTGNTVYGLHPRRVTLVDVTGDDVEDAEEAGTTASVLSCRVCVGRYVVPPDQVDWWIGTPCLRYRCPGTYGPALVEASNYYRRLYRSGTMRRVVTAEHTGMLTRAKRETLEALFKAGTDPAAPNVLACTPTMELGIDIGDLSAVLLTSMPRGPASYIQRVGRAGRLTGNSFVATFVPTEPRALYYLAQPEHMIAGEIRPPNCYLEAIELLRRQYLAFLLDRAAAGLIDAPPMPERIGGVVRGGLDEGGWLHDILGTATIDADALAGSFLALFGSAVEPATAERLMEFAAVGVQGAVKAAIDDWQERADENSRRRDRLNASIRRLEEKPHRDEDDNRDLRWLRGERHAVVDRMRAAREQYSLSALEAMGLLPNYTLLDDAATLSATLWSSDDDDDFQVEHFEYQRPAALALTEFAPGNGFYVDGHRLLIDAVEVGTATEPLEEWWRLCPECGYGAAETSRASWSTCPRCELPAMADAGARHRLLRFRQVFSADSEERTRVFDETDERDRERYKVVATVDVDPAEVVHAWRHGTETFGMELARRATIRMVNLGPAGRPGDGVRIGDNRVPAPRFRTCRFCGMVAGVRVRGRDEHRGWCLTRSGRKEDWVPLSLFHEVQTEAVRLLLPVSTFQVEERLASFKGALLLGLRLDFGGEPEHLQVTLSDYPGSGGPGRRRFLVLHDTVPGGTGYLGRLADPDRLRSILEQAREAISRCPCRDEGRIACHRCLLGSVAPREIPLVSRQLAVELLDRLLGDWRFEPIGTVAVADIGSVDESELERRFKTALRQWAADPDNQAAMTPRPAPPGRESFELRLRDGEQTVRWLVEEQRDLHTEPPTRPDILLTRQDGPATTVAVYLDGFGFHASPAHNRLADDAAKRRAVRASGGFVWALCWEDVDDFHKAVEADVSKQPPDRHLLSTAGSHAAGQAYAARGGVGPDLAAADHNPMRQLVEFLRRPDAEGWERLALSVVTGAASLGRRSWLAAEEVDGALVSALMLAVAPTGQDEQQMVLQAQWETPNDLDLRCFLDARPGVGGPNAERWTVMCPLADDPVSVASSQYGRRWRDWLQWANLLQFLRGDGRQAVICTTGETPHLHSADLVLGGIGSSGIEAIKPATEVDAGIDADAAEELELILDPATKELAETALRRGAPLPVAGYEPDAEAGSGWIVELAWPDHRVAVLADEDPARDRWLADHGWDARPAAEWTTDDLLVAVGGRS